MKDCVMRKILIVLALIVTAGFFACSDLPSDMDVKNVGINSSDNGTGSIAVLQPQTLTSYVSGDNITVYLENYIFDKKGTVADYLNGCLSSKTVTLYVKCIKRKVKFLGAKGFLNATESALIIAWAEAQLV